MADTSRAAPVGVAGMSGPRPAAGPRPRFGRSRAEHAGMWRLGDRGYG
ncbi:hypothetical protein [Nocardia wallacei]|nr:hypothetical protein [Nocardia wallacei]